MEEELLEKGRVSGVAGELREQADSCDVEASVPSFTSESNDSLTGTEIGISVGLPCESVWCPLSSSTASKLVLVEQVLLEKGQVPGGIEELREQADFCEVQASVLSFTSETDGWLTGTEVGMISTVDVASSTRGFFVLGSSLFDQ